MYGCRQLLELQKMRRRAKKTVDTRASKGRKIRYLFPCKHRCLLCHLQYSPLYICQQNLLKYSLRVVTASVYLTKRLQELLYNKCCKITCQHASYSAMLLYSRNHKGVGVTHEIISPIKQPQFPLTTMRQYRLGKTKPKRTSCYRIKKYIFNGIFY